MKIKNKREFYEYFRKGFFGNKPLQWSTIEEVEKSDYKGLFSIRGFNIPRDLVQYEITKEKLKETIEILKTRNIDTSKLKFNQSMPDQNLTIQGEIYQGIGGLYITYTKVKKPMNLALKERECFEKGLRALHLLKFHLSPSSYEDMLALFERHPESVIEFSSYEGETGDTPGRNTIIWEVRDY